MEGRTYCAEAASGGIAPGGGGLAAFGYGGGNNCQTDSDFGLVLMGHRYYDTRIGRFLTQDPAKSGGNWYAYAGNNPTNKTDPTGLYQASFPATNETEFHNGMANFVDAIQRGGETGLDAWAAIDAATITHAAQYEVRTAIITGFTSEATVKIQNL